MFKKIFFFSLLSFCAYGFSLAHWNNTMKIEKAGVEVTSLFFVDNDECNSAIQIEVNVDATCTITTTGNFDEATLSEGFNIACSQWDTPIKDVWYKFTAISETHVISLTEDINTWSIYFQLYNNSACNGPNDALYCGEGTIIATNLIEGNEYLIRVFKVESWQETDSNFDICVRTVNAPLNDECDSAYIVPVNSGIDCEQTVEGTFQDATLSEAFTSNCGAWQPSAKDIWFEFTATSDVHDVTIGGYNGWSLYVEVYNSCDEVEPIVCGNAGYLILGNLVLGNLYKIRVFTTDVTESSSFTVCVSTPIPPLNDNCSSPITAPVNNGEECIETLDATFNGSSLSPGFVGGCDDWSTPTKDVWFKFTATSSTHGISFLNYDDNFEWSVGVQVFNASDCSGLGAALSCASNTSSQVNNLIVGNEYLIRVFSTDIAVNSDFTICINTLTPPIYVSESDFTVEELVKKILVGNECLISNISWRTGTNYGDDNGIGYFSKNGSSFEFENGIVLSTAKAELAVGPASGVGGGGPDWLGDEDLAEVLAAYGQNGPLLNASVLEFDFTPTIANFKFDFIFASNEYGTYQCNYSDAFAFLLTDLTTNTTTNLAVIPGTNIPVSVTTIRDSQYNETCESQNVEYFHSYHNQWNGLDPLLSPISFYGRTVPMSAQTTVIPGRTYHIKMVIADYGGAGFPDSGVDSAVFLLGGSFNIGAVDFGEGLNFENDKALCYGDSYTLDTNLGEGFNFKWYRNGELINGATDSSYTVTESGTYKVEAAFGDTDCGLEASVLIEFYPDLNKIIKDPEDIIICNDVDYVDLTIREQGMIGNAVGSFTFEYYPTLKDLQSGTNKITNPSNYQFEGKITIFIKVVTPGENSCFATKELIVDVLPVDKPVDFDDVVICNGFKLPNLPVGQSYYSSPRASGDKLQAGQVLRKGNYTLYVYTSNGECYDERSFNVLVQECVIPRGISPNGDGLNDYFDLTEYYPTSVKIYNRYGKLVFEYGKGYTNQWNGQDSKDKLLPSGTYFYNVQTETDEYTGWVYVEREVK